MSRIPVNAVSKRRLSHAFDDTSESQFDASKRKSMIGGNVCTTPSSSIPNKIPRSETHGSAGTTRKSISSFESHMIEADLKSNQIKISTLEQDLKMAVNEKMKLEIELNSLKEKQLIEHRNLEEKQRDLEVSLRNSKTNEKYLNSELDHLRSNLDEYENVKLVDKDKEIKQLKEKLETMTNSTQTSSSESSKKIMDLQFDLETKTNQIENLVLEKQSLQDSIESLNVFKQKFEQSRVELCELQNRIKDLELENQSIKDNGASFSNFADQTKTIEQLERENRNLKTDLDYLKANEKKLHSFEEELRSKTLAIERLEKIILAVQMENAVMKDKLARQPEAEPLSMTDVTSASLSDDTRTYLHDLEDEILREREKTKRLSDDIKKVKAAMNEKEKSIEDLQKAVVRLNTERNGYKKIIDQYDSERHETDATKVLYKRIDQMEYLLNEYKKTLGDSQLAELKLCNNASYRLEESNIKTVSVQVNLNSQIYDSYESTIKQLKNDLANSKAINQEFQVKNDSLKEENSKLEDTIEKLSRSNKDQNNAENDEAVTSKKSSDNKTVAELEKKLEDQTVLNKRFLSEFERKIKLIYRTFRHLIGFKFVFLEDDEVKLTSVLNEDHFLLFKINRDHSLSLKDTEYANYFSNFIEIYLKTNHSIPSFISAIVLETQGFKVDTSM